MKHLGVFILFLNCVQIIHSQINSSIPDSPLPGNLKSIDFIHITSPISEQSIKIKAGGFLGKVEEYPDTLSKKFENEIRLSKDYYNKQRFADAKSILEIGIVEESNNLFLLNTYARAAYLIDRDRSFEVYQILIKTLDSIYNNHPDSIKIDLWFREAYWKLGTLFMDRGMWKEAYFEISRFIMSIQDIKGTPVYCQALQFLTECAYNLPDENLAIYLAKRTLYYDQRNEYAKFILKKLNNMSR